MGVRTGKHLFAKGVSGNPGGKPNPGKSKKKARLKVQEILDMMDFKPFEEMVNMYRDKATKTRYKVEILIELCNYIAPKLKNVEVSGDKSNPFIININVKPRTQNQSPLLPLSNAIIDEDEQDD